jgi:hypothetical protein
VAEDLQAGMAPAALPQNHARIIGAAIVDDDHLARARVAEAGGNFIDDGCDVSRFVEYRDDDGKIH